MELAQLQNKCKRDPAGYREEFLLQLRHFESQLKIFQLKPSKDFESFQSQVNFLSHVAMSYKDDMKEFPSQLSELLEGHAYIMQPKVRKDLVKALILLRNRGLVQPINLLSLMFKLFRVPDKALRTLLYSHIVLDIRNINLKHKNNKVNSTLQNFMFTMLQDTSEIAAKKSHEVMIELYRRNIWNDAKTVNAISTGIFSKNTKVVVATCQFFLTVKKKDEEEAEESDEEEGGVSKKDISIKFRKGVTKKSKNRAKRMQNAYEKLKKKDHKKAKNIINFAAIELINDPQGYAEKIFSITKKSTERFEVRLMMLNLISRLISYHKLLIENFYPYLQTYLKPKQENITYIMAIVAQSCHDLVPPELIYPVLREIADRFISDRSSNEAVAVGLNTVREICARAPLAMDEDLLQDLATYKDFKDKGVIIAARSLINLFREKNPALLHKRDRGKDHDIDAKPLAYGQTQVATGIDGLDLLAQYENGMLKDNDEGDDIDEDENDQEMEELEDHLELEDDSDIEDEEDDNDDENDVENDDSDDGDEGDEIQPKSKKSKIDQKFYEDKKGDKAIQPTAVSINEEKSKEVGSLDQFRILTDEDLEKIRRLKAQQVNGKRKRQLFANEKEVEIEEPTEVVDPSALDSQRKKARQNREERIQSVLAGREGRENFMSAQQRFKANKKGGKTNEEKKKNQPFMLAKMKTSVRGKVKRSLKEKQRSKINHKKMIKNKQKFKH